MAVEQNHQSCGSPSSSGRMWNFHLCFFSIAGGGFVSQARNLGLEVESSGELFRLESLLSFLSISVVLRESERC